MERVEVSQRVDSQGLYKVEDWCIREFARIARSPIARAMAMTLGLGITPTVFIGCAQTQEVRPTVSEVIPALLAKAYAQATEAADYTQKLNEERATQTAEAQVTSTTEAILTTTMVAAESTATQTIKELKKNNPDWAMREEGRVFLDGLRQLGQGCFIATGSITVFCFTLEYWYRRKNRNKREEE